MTTDLFFNALKPFKDFKDVGDEAHYHLAPTDWALFLTDIKGSTRLVEAGRYQDVNYVGAACIISALNACGVRELPFVFGGDGATLLVPPQCIEKVKLALSSTIDWARKEFGIELRAAFFPMEKIRQAGGEIKIAKYELAPGNYMAMFTGGGLALAETWLKQKPGSSGGESFREFEISPSHGTQAPLEGLSCRWAPIKNSNGLILTLLISAHRDVENKAQVYAEVLQGLSKLVPVLTSDRRPIQLQNLRSGNLFAAIKKEMRSRYPGQLLSGFFKVSFLILFMRFLGLFKIKFQDFIFEKYKTEIVLNSDYKKFDDMLRLIIDCSQEEAAKIKDYLERLRLENRINYGIHESKEALMTCVVHGTENNQHIHFIDGGDGGYSLAAKQLKAFAIN